jgi:ubiquinone/menaquinone biosynthesis C-methylase UbiE
MLMERWSKKRRIMCRYDLTASIYDMRYEEEQTAKIEAALKNDTVKANGLVLDVGCGTGLLFQHVAGKSAGVVGLDISRKTLSNAKKREKEFRNVHLVLADADHMPFNDGLFDGVYAFTVIQNLPNPEDALAEMRNVARVGSTVVVTGLKKCFSQNALISLLETAGFRVVRLEDACNLKCYVAVCQTLHP